MNLRQLETFVRVAELGSFSQAARVLGMAQPALSRQVRALETDLRDTLLLRNGRGVVLTEAGRRLFEHGVAMLQLAQRARDELSSQRDAPTGRIVIGLPPSLSRSLTLPLIDAFQRELPRARLAVVEGLSAHIAEWIATGRVDLGLLHNPQPQAALEIAPLRQEALHLVSARPARGKALGPPIALRDLPAQPLILPESSHAIRKLLDTQAALAGVQLDIAWEVSSIPAIIDLVIAGYGAAVLTQPMVAASGRYSVLQLRALAEPALATVLCLAQPARKRATPLRRRALALLRELVAAPHAEPA
jgi:LysR family nitrogen assimilation transcriptional regulator